MARNLHEFFVEYFERSSVSQDLSWYSSQGKLTLWLSVNCTTLNVHPQDDLCGVNSQGKSLQQYVHGSFTPCTPHDLILWYDLNNNWLA